MVRGRRFAGGVLVAALVATSLTVATAPAGASTIVPEELPGAVPAPVGVAARTAAPNAIAVLGDSISAGTGAGGTIFGAGQERPQDSWATGTSGGLNSLYQRLLAVNPGVSGNNYNQSSNGKRMRDTASQAQSLPLNTQYVVIQMGGNDLCRPSEAEMTSPAEYRRLFVEGLEAIAQRVPEAFIFVASIPDIYNLWYIRGSSFSTSGWAGTARLFWDNGLLDIIPCQSLLTSPTSNSATNEGRRLRVRQRNIDLNNVLAEECAKVLRCRFDDFETFNFSSNRVWSGPGQAPNSAPLKPANQWGFVDGDISTIDHFHPSFAGHRKLAAEAARVSYNWSDTTPPVVSTSVIAPPTAADPITVRASATDAAGIRGLQHRLHRQSGGTTAWSTVFGDTADIVVDRLDPGFVEVRALDRNGNFSSGKMTGAFPTPAAPAGPTFNQIVQNNVEGMRVTWRAPADETGTRGQVAPTIAYEVTASPGGQSCRVEAASSDPVDIANIATGCLVSGLTYGVTYSFTVRAFTQGGAGPAATARTGGSTSATFLGPSAPVRSLGITPSGADLVVNWSAPANLGGGTLLGYEVRFKLRDSEGDPQVIAGCGTTVASPRVGLPPVTTYFTGTQCALRNVSRVDDYDFEVRAITELSSSPVLPKPILNSDPASITGWLPDLPELDDAPLATASLANRSVTVSWPAIAPRQRPPGTTVTVTAQPGGASCTVPADVTSCVLTGLNYLLAYRFVVVVNNGAGTVTAETGARLERSFLDALPFADIPARLDWVIEPARWLRANGVSTGVGGTNNFAPSEGVTREQMAAFLYRFAGEPPASSSCGFRDQAQIAPYARPGACWLLANGITTNNPYNPKGAVTREQMAAFLWRLAGEPAALSSCGFADTAQIPTYAQRGACWLLANGITTNNPYNPKGAVTRGQMAAFLYRANAVLND